MHTCADSCALLVNLLQYITSAGDLHPPPRPPSPTEIAGQKLSESPASLPSCLPVETALINQRDLTDALLDTERSLRELAQPSGRVQGLWGQPTLSARTSHIPPKPASLSHRWPPPSGLARVGLPIPR